MIAKTIRTCFPIAAAAVSDKAEEINKLNVFPVPDGDTGTNMSLTLASVTKELSALPADADMEAIAGAITHGSLMGARGNSGVITSQILRGVAEGLVSADEPITSANIAFAFRRAVKVAFQAARPAACPQGERRGRLRRLWLCHLPGELCRRRAWPQHHCRGFLRHV